LDFGFKNFGFWLLNVEMAPQPRFRV
jgi:hypothetical protein